MKQAAVVLVVVMLPLAPAPTNPLCYNNQAYRNTHEQECLIDQVQSPWSGGGGNVGGGGGHDGLIGGLLGRLL